MLEIANNEGKKSKYYILVWCLHQIKNKILQGDKKLLPAWLEVISWICFRTLLPLTVIWILMIRPLVLDAHRLWSRSQVDRWRRFGRKNVAEYWFRSNETGVTQTNLQQWAEENQHRKKKVYKYSATQEDEQEVIKLERSIIIVNSQQLKMNFFSESITKVLIKNYINH